jgi:hypothetical protein
MFNEIWNLIGAGAKREQGDSSLIATGGDGGPALRLVARHNAMKTPAEERLPNL